MQVFVEGLQEVFGTVVALGGIFAGVAAIQWKKNHTRGKQMALRLEGQNRQKRRKEAVRFAQMNGAAAPQMKLVYDERKTIQG